MQQASWYSTWSVFTIVCSHSGALHQQDIQHRRQQHHKGIVYYHMHIYKLQTSYRLIYFVSKVWDVLDQHCLCTVIASAHKVFSAVEGKTHIVHGLLKM